jgi:Ca-activated chloride channel family protein
VTSDGRSLALVGARLLGEAQGGLARLVLEQMFENTYDENLRVTYRMPLPADGAVSGYEFELGDRIIKGTIDKKHQARERFERAIASGHTAALLEQERADIFTQQIGNIPARTSVIARITIDQRLVWLPEGEWELRFPTVIGPRYIGKADTAADVRATHIKVTEQPLRSTIQIAIVIKDSISGGGKPSSPSHGIEYANSIAELKSGARLDRDIVLRWAVATPAVGLSLAAARPAQGPLTDSFGLLTIVPPARDTKPVAVPRDLVVLLDTSGSMSGFPLDKAKQVVAMLVDSLDENDRFELIEFNYSPTRYLAEPTYATPKAKQAAINWIRSRVADGGTEIRAAVIEAMDTLRVGAQRQVIVVTDGYVGGEQQIIEAMNRRLPKSCRVHVLGVGSAVNRSLATSLARAGRGVEVLIGIDEDAERGAKRLLDRTAHPVVTNVEVSGSALLRQAPALMPDCFEGSPLVAALALRPEGGTLVVRGQLARGTWEQTIEVPALQPGDGNQAIIALYGRERVADVEANALFSSVNGEIEELGLSFQIATRMTSWIAVDETRKVTGPSRDQLVPQELPYGTSAAAFGLRGSQQQISAQSNVRTMTGLIPQIDALRTIDLDDSREDARYDLGAVASSYSVDTEEEADFGEEAPQEPPAPRQMAPMAPSTRGRIMKSYEQAEGGAPDEDFLAEEPTGQTLSAAADKSVRAEQPRLLSVQKVSRDEDEPARRAADDAPTIPPPTAGTRSQQRLEAPPPARAKRSTERSAAPPMPEPEAKPAAPSMVAQSPVAGAPSKVVLGQVTPVRESGYVSHSVGAGGAPSLDQMNALGAPMQPEKQRSRWPVFLGLVLVLALIALLLWWLLG